MQIAGEEVFQNYLSRSLKSALAADSQLTHCFAPGCSGICLIEDDLRSFYCPICAKLNCIDCKSIHDRPCKRNKRKPDKDGVIDLADSEEDGDDEEVRIAMKLPVAETEAEAKLRKEWEASWEQLVSKFNSGKQDVIQYEINFKYSHLNNVFIN